MRTIILNLPKREHVKTALQVVEMFDMASGIKMYLLNSLSPKTGLWVTQTSSIDMHRIIRECLSWYPMASHKEENELDPHRMQKDLYIETTGQDTKFAYDFGNQDEVLEIIEELDKDGQYGCAKFSITKGDGKDIYGTVKYMADHTNGYSKVFLDEKEFFKFLLGSNKYVCDEGETREMELKWYGD